MQSPLISIIIPLYNAEKVILETLDSVLKQSHQNIEIVVIDDHSTDDSYNVVTQCVSDKIKLIKNPKKGACAARSYGFEQSKGEYIQYLDADDLISPNKLKDQLALLENKNQVASCGWLKFIDEIKNLTPKHQEIDKSYNPAMGWLIDSWNGKGFGVISMWLTPRQLIEKSGEWNNDLIINQDGEFFCRVLLNAKSIIYCPNSIVYYRSNNPNSISQQKQSHGKGASLLNSFKLYENHIAEYLIDINVRKAIGNKYLNFIYHYNKSYPDLTKLAWEYFNDLNVGKPWNIGGKKFQLLTSIFGFKLSLKITKLIG